ncbi:hypothetical protein [Deminuibacter soli]|uniref:Uncharacterized protein n=1 Tax=Deminuibacter soli TaxID=2291815 RepID=A0A3E1NJ17_9BACT|nr:hypothetical protein [Deminuibacter soli]RFM27927.1 hypothetical protein DXN05_10290 [Deminuibacter soli]
MKVLGIIKEHETSLVKKGISLNDLTILPASSAEIIKLCEYLSSGKVVAAFLHYIFDGENAIAPLAYYTDGEFIWPSYLSYYVNKGYFSLLSEEFILNVKEHNYMVKDVSKNENK